MGSPPVCGEDEEDLRGVWMDCLRMVNKAVTRRLDSSGDSSNSNRLFSFSKSDNLNITTAPSEVRKEFICFLKSSKYIKIY